MPDCSTELSDQEESFEGVANGQMNGSMESSVLEPHSHLHAPVPHPRNGSLVRTSSTRRSGGGTLGTAFHNGISRRSSFSSDLDMPSVSDAELHTGITEISNQVTKIQEALSSFEDGRMDETHVRLKSDNAVLQERIRAMEDTLTTTEERWKEKLHDARNSHKENISRLERERSLQVETLNLKVQLLERDHSQCTEVSSKLTSELDSLKLENTRLEERVEVLERQLSDVTENHDDAESMLKSTQSAAQQQLRDREDLISELQEKLIALQSQVQRPRADSVAEHSSELMEELESLRSEHRHLKQANEDLQSQLIETSVMEGKNLLNGSTGLSLADELNMETANMDHSELMHSLQKQEADNQRLRMYVDTILIRVIEMHPEILEVK